MDDTDRIAPVPPRGRHRRGGDTWTPRIPPRGSASGRHAAVNGGPVPAPRAGDDLFQDFRDGYQDDVNDGLEDTDDLGVLGPLEPVEPPEVDPFADTGSLGLGKFNLGTVPASVTPPVTWRRAAWFSVLAAAGVLVALIALSTALMGPPRSTQTIGLPGVLGEATYPDGRDDGTEPWRGGTSTHHDRSTRTEDATGHRDTGGRPDGERGHTAPEHRSPGGDPDAPRGGSGGSGGGSGGPSDSEPEIVPTAPPRVVVAPTSSRAPFRAQPPVNGRSIAKHAISYYRLVTADPQAAYELTDGQDDPQSIAARYADVRSIRVAEVYSDPNTARTVSQVTIVREDGSTEEQQRTLEFTRDADPKIHTDY